jgi:hypothetical protein
MNQQKQSPSTGESTQQQDQKQQEPARSDVPGDAPEKPDVSRSGAESSGQQGLTKGPKSGGMGPKQ